MDPSKDGSSVEKAVDHAHENAATEPAPAQQENMLLNLLLNIVIPTLILVKGSKEAYLGPTMGLLVALAFPIAYGIYDYLRVKKANVFSIIGIISVMLTGGISLLKLPPEYIAIKEASIPAIIGLICLGSTYTRYPLVRTFLYNDKVMQVKKVHAALASQGNVDAFERVLKNASYLLAASFFLSAVLNYVLAKMVVVSAPGSEQYNEQLGKMMALSFPVITIPTMVVTFAALFYLFRNITRLTQLHWEEILNQPPEKK